MRKKDVYSPYKFMNYGYKLEQLKQGELPTPAFVQWDLTNKCNLNCSFCFYRNACTEKGHKLTDWDVNEEMPTSTVMKTLEELKQLGVRAIEWTGGGSIEMHPDWKQIFKRAKELGFKQALVTNGTLLDDDAIELIKDFEWVRFSIDSASPETYEKVKGVDLYYKAIAPIKKLIAIKAEHNVIGFSFVVCPDNHLDIAAAAKLAKELECDNFRISLAMTPLGDKLFLDIWDKIVEQIDAAKELQTEDFRVFAFSNRIKELAKTALSDYCGYHHFVGVIAPRGVYPCCRLKDDARFRLGDLNKQSFSDIWFGEKRRKFIKSIENGCPFDCWMTEKNKFIEYLLQDNPMHKEFT